MVRRLVLVLLAALLVVCSAASAQVSFTASVDKNVVAVGDTLTLTLTMSGAAQLPEPELPPLIGFDLMYDRGTSTSVRIVNGVMTSSVSRQYVLAPKEEGEFVLGAATLRYGGSVHRTEPIQVQVVAVAQLPQQVPTEPENLFVTLAADKEEVFLGEQVNLYFRLYVRGVQLVGEPRREGPITEGFLRHDLPVTRSRDLQNGLVYEVGEIPIVLFPLETGELTISPVTLTGEIRVPLPRRRSRGVFRDFDDFFADRYTAQPYRLVTDPVTIHVKPLPDEDRPPSFSGNVGYYSLDVSAKPSQLKVGEPISVTMRIAGKGNVEAVSPPVISDIENFKTYEPEITTNVVEKEPVFKGERIFEAILVPQRPGRQVIQNVAFSFFDPEKEDYVTLAKGPFEFNVLPAPVEPMRRVVAVDTGPGKSEIRVVGEDIRPIFTEMGRTGRPEPVAGAGFIVPLGVPPLAYAMLALALARKRKLASDVAYARKQRATRDARKRLAMATKALKRGDGTAFCGEMTKAVTGFVADKFGIPSAGLTAVDVRERLESAGVPEDLVKRVTGLLEACDYGRFAASAHTPGEMASILDGARYVLSELQRVLGRSGVAGC